MTNIRNLTKEVYTKIFGRCRFNWILPTGKDNCSGRLSVGDSSCEICPFYRETGWTEHTY